MSAFDAGALVFKLQTVGAQVFKQDQADAKQAIEKTGQAAGAAKGQVDGLGKASDETAKKSKAAKAPLDDQAKSTKKVGEESEQASKKQDQQKVSTEQQTAAAKELSRTLLLVGAAAAAMVTLAVAKNTEFDQAMSNTRAATMATASEQKKLGEAALEAGADTAYSASEAAAAEEELAKAGLTVANIVGGSLNGALALAAAGQLQVARSAEIMATTLTQFGLTADKSGHVADVLAAGAGKAQGSVDDLALALTYVGPLAKAAGWGLEETGGTLAYFASQGILGEKAGTSLRGVLAALQAPSRIASKTMDQYGLSVYDANGKMLSASQMAAQLQKAFAGLTDEERNAAMGRIFGNESLTAATLLYDGGSQAISKWTDEVNDSGFAAEQAAMRQDNLAGDIEKLGGAFDTALIKTGSGANDVLREMVQAVTAMVDVYGEAPDAVQGTTLVLGIAAAAMLLLAGGAVGVRAKFIELKTTFDTTNASMRRTALIGGGVGLALTGIITVVGLLMAKQAEARRRAEAYAEAIESGADRSSEAFRDLADEALDANQKLFGFFDLGADSAYESAEKLGISLGTVRDAALGNVDALQQLQDIQQEIQNSDYTALQEKYGDDYALAEARINGVVDAVKGENSTIEDAIGIAERKQRADKESADSSQTAVDAYIAEADSVDELESNLSDLIDTINEANGVNQDAISANRDYQQTISDVKDQIDAIAAGTDGYAKGLSLNTQAGRDNMEMLQGLAQDSQSAAEATFAVDGNTASYIERLKEGRQRLIDSARAMGASAEEAEALADKIYKIPSQKEIDIIADTVSAEKRLEIVRQKVEAIPGFRRITLETVTYGNRTVSAAGSDFPGRAEGGPVVGPGTGTSDTAGLYRLSNGEHVITAREVQAAGGHAGMFRLRRALLDGGDIPVGLFPGRAAGGPIYPLRDIGDSMLHVASSSSAPGDLRGAGLQALIAEVRSLRDALGRPNVTIKNPVTRDPIQDMWDATEGRF